MFTTLYNTGARVSELTGMRVGDLRLAGASGFITIHGKGRKERTVPLWKSTVGLLNRWSREVARSPISPLFPTADGSPLSRSAVELRLRHAASEAAQVCTSLRSKVVSPHVIRHTMAIHMLQAGVDLAVIALWLGHESIQTTHMYMEADLQTKERAMLRMEPVAGKRRRFQPSDRLLQFLEGL